MSHTIQEIKKFPIGTVVPHITGTVKAVFPRKTGEGQYGPWSVQTVILSDAANDEIPCSCWGFDELGHLKGQSVSVAATGKDRRTNKASGTEIKEGKDKQGVARPELHVSHGKGGFIGGDEPNPAFMANKGQEQPAEAPQAPIPSNSSPSKPQPKGIEGVTVGMAVNCAVRLCVANGIEPALIDEYVHEKASALIRISQKLQAGELL